jgi:hypothetical protein
MLSKRLVISILIIATAGFALAGVSEAAKPTPTLLRPKLPGAAGALQIGIHSSLAATDGFNRAEMQLKHESPIIQPTTPGSAYSFSLIGVTNNGWRLRMGYIVYESDTDGWARWFIQVFDNTGKEVYWNVSRAGETNPPPASSCSSGDGTCNGYPFSFGLTSSNTWTFWFDWISKARVRLTGAGSALTDVYFLGELTGAGSGETMGPRTALTTYRVWNGGPSWVEPATATRAELGLACGSEYGVTSAGLGPARANNVQYHATIVGSGVSCNDPLWP